MVEIHPPRWRRSIFFLFSLVLLVEAARHGVEKSKAFEGAEKLFPRINLLALLGYHMLLGLDEDGQREIAGNLDALSFW